MKRGEVWWVNFEPAVGGEIRKQRPVQLTPQRIALNKLIEESRRIWHETTEDAVNANHSQ